MIYQEQLYTKKLKNMIYKINIIIRIILLSANIYLGFYFFQIKDKNMTVIVLAVLSVIQVFLLINYLFRVNRSLGRLLSYAAEGDSTIVFDKKFIETQFKGFLSGLEKINRQIKEARIKKETLQLLMFSIIEHVETGLMALREDGSVYFVNPSGLKIFSLDFLTDISDLDKITPGISQNINELKPGRTKLIKIISKERILPVSFRSKQFKIASDKLHLISFQDISTVLEENEIESWQKLMRILNHEIMNSITPIYSMSAAIKKLFKEQNSKEWSGRLDEEIIKDIIKKNEIIEGRSRGLMDFVEKYRTVFHLPDLNMSEIKIDELFNNVNHLMSAELKSENIHMKIEYCGINQILLVDVHLIEQVLINLIKNSILALKNTEEPLLLIRADFSPGMAPKIEVKDNGHGINKEIIHDIFIPFFTTRKDGSGIGLSLSRQIMKKHGGGLYVKQGKDRGVVFTMQF